MQFLKQKSDVERGSLGVIEKQFPQQSLALAVRIRSLRLSLSQNVGHYPGLDTPKAVTEAESDTGCFVEEKQILEWQKALAVLFGHLDRR